MGNEQAKRLRRAVRIAYSLRSLAGSYRVWRHVTAGRAADVLLLPLTLLMLMLFLFGSVPGASDMIAAACSVACMP